MPRPNTQNMNAWADQGECRDMEPSLFYPKPSNMLASGRGRPPRGEGISPEAKAACARCPVVNECADWAIPHEGYGYWGGLTEKERASIRNREGIILWEPQSSITYIGGIQRSNDRRERLDPVMHGTSRGYKMERRRGMEPCTPCRQAHTAQTGASKAAKLLSA